VFLDAPRVASSFHISKDLSELRGISGLHEHEISPQVDNFIEGRDIDRTLLVTVQTGRAGPQGIL
jgi:hypothetical protein